MMYSEIELCLRNYYETQKKNSKMEIVLLSFLMGGSDGVEAGAARGEGDGH
jgi:hypothetical protein